MKFACPAAAALVSPPFLVSVLSNICYQPRLPMPAQKIPDFIFFDNTVPVYGENARSCMQIVFKVGA
jgi:hypothetical protein